MASAAAGIETAAGSCGDGAGGCRDQRPWDPDADARRRGVLMYPPSSMMAAGNCWGARAAAAAAPVVPDSTAAEGGKVTAGKGWEVRVSRCLAGRDAAAGSNCESNGR